MTRPALLACALLAASLLACGDPRAPIEPGEENPGGATTNTLLFGRNAFIRPATNLSDAHEQTFHAGNSLFNSPWVEAPASTTRRDGLGPHFNARSCAACHLRDGRGAPPEGDEPFLGLLIRLHVPGPDGTVLPDPTYGGQIQPFALPALPAEATPRVTYTERPGRYADGEPYTRLEPTYTLDNVAHGPLDPTTRLSPRGAPAVIGLGLLEAIPPARLLALADPDDADGDGISGRIQTVWHIEAGTLAIGRFGWRAEQPTVRQQAAAALAGDIGITSPLFPAENCAPPQTDCRAQPSGAEANETEIKPADLDQLVLYSQQKRLLVCPGLQS